LDGLFGDQSARALSTYQKSAGLPPTGAVDAETWQHLVSPQPPSLMARCLQVTADFEGHGFGRVVGNEDGAGLTWGIIGFTLASGSLQRVLAEVRDRALTGLKAAFGPFTPGLLHMLEAPRAEQLRWALGICRAQGGHDVHPAWTAAFRLLGQQPEVQGIQLAHTQPYWQRAHIDARRFGLRTELGLALCFDIAVQNGGIDPRTAADIRQAVASLTSPTEAAIRRMIATAVAAQSRPVWVEAVRRRTLALASGQGEVNQARYDLATWGLADVPAEGEMGDATG